MERRDHRRTAFGFISIGVVLFCSVLFISFQSNTLFKDLLGLTNKKNIGVAYTIPDLPGTIEEVQSECSQGECVSVCLAHLNTMISREQIFDPELLEHDVYLVYYRVKDNEIVEPRIPKVRSELIPLQNNIELHNEIWNYFQAIFPSEARPDLIQFVVYVSSTSGGMFDSTPAKEWLLHFNLIAAQDAYRLTKTLVHEYGHYLTLNASQKISWLESKVCKQEIRVYGCPTPDSYLNLFYEKFWKDIYSDWDKAYYESSNKDRALELFYTNHSDRFINEYSSTNPIEDIAESWEYFVLAPMPTGNTEPEQKIKFFYEFPELVHLRYQIIKGICSYH